MLHLRHEDDDHAQHVRYPKLQFLHDQQHQVDLNQLTMKRN